MEFFHPVQAVLFFSKSVFGREEVLSSQIEETSEKKWLAHLYRSLIYKRNKNGTLSILVMLSVWGSNAFTTGNPFFDQIA